jgi:hypothetical protein
MASSLRAVSPAIELQRFYRACFGTFTTGNCERFLNLQDLFTVAGRIYTILGYDGSALENRRRSIADDFLDITCDYFAWLELLRSIFGDLQGSLVVYPARAFLQKLASQWPIQATPGNIALGKGLATHIVEARADRADADLLISGLFLQPALNPGLQVLHLATGVFGTILQHEPGGVHWVPLGEQASRLDDPYAVLPLTPCVLPSGCRVPRVTIEDVLAEFRLFYPFDQRLSQVLSPTNPATQHQPRPRIRPSQAPA